MALRADHVRQQRRVHVDQHEAPRQRAHRLSHRRLRTRHRRRRAREIHRALRRLHLQRHGLADSGEATAADSERVGDAAGERQLEEAAGLLRHQRREQLRVGRVDRRVGAAETHAAVGVGGDAALVRQRESLQMERRRRQQRRQRRLRVIVAVGEDSLHEALQQRLRGLQTGSRAGEFDDAPVVGRLWENDDTARLALQLVHGATAVRQQVSQLCC